MADGLPAMAQAWDLSKTEQEVLLLLLSGMSPDEIAVHRSRGIETVRTQIKSIMRKGGATRLQSLLVSLLVAEK